MTIKREPWKRSETSDRDQMSLPQEKTCGVCALFERCQAFVGHVAEDEVCDWSPCQFQEKASEP